MTQTKLVPYIVEVATFDHDGNQLTDWAQTLLDPGYAIGVTMANPRNSMVSITHGAMVTCYRRPAQIRNTK